MGLTRLAAARRECWQIPRMFSGLVSQRLESEPADAGWEATRRHVCSLLLQKPRGHGCVARRPKNPLRLLFVP